MNLRNLQTISLKNRITLLMLVILVGGIWSVAIYSSRQLYGGMLKLSGEQQFTAASFAAAAINDELENRFQIMHTVARVTSPHMSDNAALQKFLDDRLTLKNMFNGGVIFHRTDGTAIAESPLSAGRIGTNYMEIDSVSIALREGRSTVGKPIIGKKLKQPVIGMSVPVRNRNGEIIGALSGVIRLEGNNFLDKIAGNRYGKTGGYLLTVPQHRIVITGTDKKRIMEPLQPAGENKLLDRFMGGYDGTELMINKYGQEVLVSVKSVPAAGWHMVVELPSKEAFEPVRAMRQRILMSTLVLTLIAAAITRWILQRQLSQMSLAARTLSAMGDVSLPFKPLPVSRMDEAGELISGFNRLLAILEEREKALKESQSLWRFAVEGSGDGVWDWNTTTNIVNYSRRWKEMLGYEEDEIKPLHLEWLDRLHPDDMQHVMQSMQEYLEGKTGLYVAEYRLRCKDGSYKWILSRGMAVTRDDQGRPLRMVGMHTDISGHKQMEQELLKIEKLESLGVLAGGIAHDFNNILAGIMGNISLARKFVEETHKAAKPLQAAEKASRRAAELSHQLLTFAKGGEPVKKLIDVGSILNESISLVLHGSTVKAIREIRPSLDTVLADEGQLSQVFNNIIINATQAMPGGGTMTVSASNVTLPEMNSLGLPVGSYVQIAFADQGCGIAEDAINKIFDPYFTTKSTGNGLGLASAHSIISRHGGHIGVSSRVGHGTTFTIHLPSLGSRLNQQTNLPETEAAPPPCSARILVMDDEELLLDMTCGLLEAIGYQAARAASGEEAIAQYKQAITDGKPFAAVIMDLTIPGGMGGREAAEQLLSLDPAACLIVSSGYSNDPIVSDFEKYGFKAAIAKPYSVDKLIELLGRLFPK